ncbi:MAG TPA: DUF2807 domain-containing protein [Crenotrichaceae bacterium]|nr:DUF2807 domain-containing protein [Crenotrichaceae bacterium]
MNFKWNVLFVLAFTGFSGTALSEAVTGKIMIDGQEYGSGSSNVIQGSGNIVTDKRKLSAFDKLSVNIAADIEYIASDRYQLVLTADDNIAPVVTSVVRGSTLLIDTERSYSTGSRVHAKVYGPALLGQLLLDGSSDINLQGIAGNSFEINLDGTGDITAQGKVKNLIIQVDGSGHVDTKALHAENVTINVDGSTDVVVTATNKLDVTIDGVSDVTYYGHPNAINKSIDGVGEVTAGN